MVIIVVDQMRADYVSRFERTWTRGLRRLVNHGAWFTNAAYPYLTTVTCAGHATIATGAFPRTHGVFQNAWYDRTDHRLVTCTEDQKVQTVAYGPSTTLRAGESAARLRIPTLADALRAQRGGTVATVSLKARSAIMLAGHGGTVTWLSDSFDRWETSTAFSSGPVPAVQRYLQGNSFDDDFGRAWTRLLPAKAYRGADAGQGEAPPQGWTSTFPHVLAGTNAGVPDSTFRQQWVRSPFADAYLGRFAASVAESLQMGQRSATDFLGIGFSAPDLVGHAFGPRSHEVQDLYAQLDRTIGDLFDRLDRLAGRGRWLVALTGDHGATGLPEQAPWQSMPARGIEPGVIKGRVDTRRLTDVLERKVDAGLGPGTSVSYVARINGNDVYFAPGVYDRLAAASTLDDVVRLLEAQPGIARVFRRDELGSPIAAHDRLPTAAALSYVPDLSGDLMMALQPGWTFAATGSGHGTGSPDDQRVPILMMGPGIRPGRYREAVTPADIAPTLAALAGVTLPGAAGRVLSSARQP